MSETNDAKLKEGSADDADDADDAGAYIANWPELSNAVLLDFTACFQFVADQFCFACLNWDPLCHIMFLLFFGFFFFPWAIGYTQHKNMPVCRPSGEGK